MMTPEQAEQWAQALESDEYDQITGHLGHDKNYYKYRCCLGVCVEKFDPKNVEYDKDDEDNVDYLYHVDKFWTGKPNKVFQEKYLGYGDNTQMFIKLNDFYRISFENIAKVVRHLYIYDMKEPE